MGARPHTPSLMLLSQDSVGKNGLRFSGIRVRKIKSQS